MDVRVTTSLTAASHEDGALLNGLLRRGNNAPQTATWGLEDGIVPDRKIRTHTSRRDILKELLELHFSCERSEHL